MQVDVRTNLKGFKKQLSRIHRKELPFALSMALNDTAEEAMYDTRKLMRDSFKDPIKQYLVGGIRYQRAKRKDGIDRMFARVDIENFGNKGQPRRDIMKPHIEGGDRKQKKSEKLLLGPGRYLYPSRTAARDKFGNLKPSQIVKAISDIGRNFDPAQNTKSKRKKKKYFAINTRRQRTIIMERNGKNVTPLMVEGAKPSYRKRFDFYGGVQRSADKNFNKHMGKALAYVIKNPKKR